MHLSFTILFRRIVNVVRRLNRLESPVDAWKQGFGGLFGRRGGKRTGAGCVDAKRTDVSGPSRMRRLCKAIHEQTGCGIVGTLIALDFVKRAVARALN